MLQVREVNLVSFMLDFGNKNFFGSPSGAIMLLTSVLRYQTQSVQFRPLLNLSLMASIVLRTFLMSYLSVASENRNKSGQFSMCLF